MSKCIGCGIKLQNENKEEVGYTKDLENKYCERCFKTIHYNEERKVLDIDNDKILNKINKSKNTVLFITDLLSINQKLINVFKSIKNDKMLVINKCDLIPNHLMLEHIEENIKSSYGLENDITFISAKQKYNLNRIVNIIKDKKEVIFCGETSSGKSTLINSLIGSNLTTSKYSNTTLEFIKLKFEDYTIYDTPGILLEKEKNSINKINLKTMQMNENYILNIGGTSISSNGNFTILYSDNLKMSSKKGKINKYYEYKIDRASDIELKDGFIFVKKPCIIKSDEELIIRKSIIGK